MNDNIKDIIHFFNKAGKPNFKLGALELKLFKDESQKTFIIPNLLLRTEILEDEVYEDNNVKDYSRKNFIEYDFFIEQLSEKIDESKDITSDFISQFDDFGANIRLGTSDLILDVGSPRVGLMAFGKDGRVAIRTSHYMRWCDKKGIDYESLIYLLESISEYFVNQVTDVSLGASSGDLAAGQVLQYDGTKWINAQTAVPSIGPEPSSPINGQLWFDDAISGKLYMWNINTWVQISS